MLADLRADQSIGTYILPIGRRRDRSLVPFLRRHHPTRTIHHYLGPLAFMGVVLRSSVSSNVGEHTNTWIPNVIPRKTVGKSARLVPRCTTQSSQLPWFDTTGRAQGHPLHSSPAHPERTRSFYRPGRESTYPPVWGLNIHVRRVARRCYAPDKRRSCYCATVRLILGKPANDIN